MLVLCRRIGESINSTRDGERVFDVKVLKIHGGKVWLGIDAPADVVIRRTELPERQPEEAPS